MTNYFIVAGAFLAAAYATSVEAGAPAVAAAVGVLGVAFAICFQLIDIRTRELIRLGEAALSVTEGQIQKDTKINEIEFVGRGGGKAPNRHTSYRRIIFYMHVATAICFAGGTLYALVWMK